jgi:MoaA/NifB/PqqE/SkfB family radical SAM enzyme
MSTAKQKAGQPFSGDKIYGHMDRVAEWLETGKSRPVTYELDLTNICNQKCPHCVGYFPELDQARMHRDEARGVIRQISEFGGRGLTFTGGGDPLVSPIAMDAVAYARSVGLDVGFITNGQALTEDKARVLLANCQWIRVSLDAATPEIFLKSHGMDEKAWRQVLAAVRRLAELKRETGSSCTVGIGFLTSDETKQDIYAFAELGKELGVDYAQYRPLLRRFGRSDVDYSDGSILDEMARAAKLSTENYKVLHSEHKYRLIQAGKVEREYKKCHGQNFAAVVSADKKMYVCCHMRGVEKYCIGDLSKQTLPELWGSKKREEVAESVDFKDCPPLCRCDSFNTILWDLEKSGEVPEQPFEPKEHPNFI